MLDTAKLSRYCGNHVGNYPAHSMRRQTQRAYVTHQGSCISEAPGLEFKPKFAQCPKTVLRYCSQMTFWWWFGCLFYYNLYILIVLNDQAFNNRNRSPSPWTFKTICLEALSSAFQPSGAVGAVAVTLTFTAQPFGIPRGGLGSCSATRERSRGLHTRAGTSCTAIKMRKVIQF